MRKSLDNSQALEVSDSKPVSVLIAHPEVLTGELLESSLNRKSAIQVTARATSLKAILEAADKKHIDVALVAAALADGPQAGYQAVRQMRSRKPGIRSVMLFDDPTADQVVSAFRAGAKGVFCPSVADFRMLCRCVERVHDGQIWAKSLELEYLVDALQQPRERFEPLRIQDGPGLEKLSKREEDVLQLLGVGLSNREIASQLQLSVHTVKNYLYRIFDKVGVSSRTELLVFASNSGRREDRTP